MNTTMRQDNWSTFLKLFSEKNKTRPTRLGVFKREFGVANDYWIEDGLPLAGIEVDAHDGGGGSENALSVEILLGDAAQADSIHLRHSVAGARVVKIILSAGGDADGLDIEGDEDKTTILRFEN